MRAVRKFTFVFVSLVCMSAILGCGEKADENKPISEVKAEAEKMSIDKLRAKAMEYKEAIVAKKADYEKLAAKLKDIPVAEMIGEEAKALKADMENLEESISKLRERFEVYYDKLKEKGGELTGLDI